LADAAFVVVLWSMVVMCVDKGEDVLASAVSIVVDMLDSIISEELR
jgi:hypothetical protein